ncbi:peptidoglycan-binding domain-containing protein [Paracoccus siganidrum]|nr:peptidoglycan-binding domain-containing protein [Paracoccus siganidrum]
MPIDRPEIVEGVLVEADALAGRQFQRANGLVADGIIGSRSWAALLD